MLRLKLDNLTISSLLPGLALFTFYMYIYIKSAKSKGVVVDQRAALHLGATGAKSWLQSETANEGTVPCVRPIGG